MAARTFQEYHPFENGMLTRRKKGKYARVAPNNILPRRVESHYDDMSSHSTSATYALTDDEEECASFLLTLKYRVAPNIEDELEKMRRYPPRLCLLSSDETLMNEEENHDQEGFDEPKTRWKSEKTDSITENLPSCVAASYDSMRDMLGECKIVVPEDLILVPDYLFFAMAQMRPCTVTEADRVGCYKNRDLGFAGMCCKHCGGQPGFGKYFPATVRSLAQTTTSQTILRHIGTKCRYCPWAIRDKLLDLQLHATGGNYGRGGSSKEAGKPKYGSRKVFFERLWGRLHGEEIPGIPADAMPGAESHDNSDMSSLEDDASTSTKSSHHEVLEDMSHHDDDLSMHDVELREDIEKEPHTVTSNNKRIGNARRPNNRKRKEEMIETPVVSGRRGTRNRKATKFYSL